MLNGSGPKGIVLKSDILKYIKEKRLSSIHRFKAKDYYKQYYDKLAKKQDTKPADKHVANLLAEEERRMKEIDHFQNKLFNYAYSLQMDMIKYFVKSLIKTNYRPKTLVHLKDSASMQLLSLDTFHDEINAAQSLFETDAEGYSNRATSYGFVILAKYFDGVEKILADLPKRPVASLIYFPLNGVVETNFNSEFGCFKESLGLIMPNSLNLEFDEPKRLKILMNYDSEKLKLGQADDLFRHLKTYFQDERFC
eukprot:CAMPEP_0168333422 /NCGR_PEP_ID=MMETSP0213-20121227/9602_1 /TAXON_ID=151035 /ORGANISM="Euplotes harpa, Strain FSP1.4" /LENGTH=251 /DNA_ID=CAMNT_0008337751 /DNA_START=118 /DNA_END=873 /DNA_ORIENTATION=-